MLVLHSCVLEKSSLVIAIVGPTAVGKTSVALELTKQLDGKAEILSADSVQVYKRLNIGSAKPDAAEQSGAKFHLIDLIEPDQDFTLSDYQGAAIEAHSHVVSGNKTPILAGGTGLYIRSLTQPLCLPHVAPDEQFRDHWRTIAAERGGEFIHNVLRKSDPVTALRLHPNDTKRIIRALEVLEHTGRRLSEWHAQDQATNPALFLSVKLFGLMQNREHLNATIDSRVDAMMRAGFAEEVGKLLSAGFARTLKSMQSLGYKEMCAFHHGDLSLDDARQTIKLRTRQFARRQLIWFRADRRIHWIDIEERSLTGIAEDIIDHCSGITESAGR